MGLFDLFKRNKYGGQIKYLGLIDFWKDLSEKERTRVRKYAKMGLGGRIKEIDDPQSKGVTSQSSGQFLNSIGLNAVSEKDYTLAEKLLLKAVEKSKDILYLHLAYTNLIKLYYKQRDKNDYINKCINICKKDIKLYEKLKKRIENTEYEDIHIPSFKRLTIIYDKQREYKKAINICKKAMKYELDDRTKTGFEGRLKRLKKKT